MSSDNVDKLIAFGQMALEQGWYDQAREYFEQALELDAANREAMKGFARANEILSRRAASEWIRPEVPPAKPARKRHPIAEWVREKRREYAEWMEIRRKEREKIAAERLAAHERRAAERLAAAERRRQWMLEREAEEYREWWEAGVAAWEVGYYEEDADPIISGALPDYDDFF